MYKVDYFVVFGIFAVVVQNVYCQAIGAGCNNGLINNGLALNNGIANNLALNNGIANNLALNNGIANNLALNSNLARNGIGNGLAGASSSNAIGYGDVAIAGELPVGGSTAVTGNVPVIGYVTFEGTVPAGGIVSVATNCGCKK